MVNLEILNLDNDIIVFIMKEDIMGYMVDTLKDRICKSLSENKRKVILDLNMIDYIDSLGIGAVIEVFKKIRKEDGNMVIINVSPPIYKLITMLNVEKILNIRNNMEEAIEFLKSV